MVLSLLLGIIKLFHVQYTARAHTEDEKKKNTK